MEVCYITVLVINVVDTFQPQPQIIDAFSLQSLLFAHRLDVWSALCGCGFLTALFGFLPLPCWLALIYDSLGLMVQNQDLCLVLWLDRCRLIGLLTSLSVLLTHTLPLEEVRDRVRWPVSESAVDQHPSAPTHSSSPPSPLLSAKGIGLTGEPTHLQTRPPDLISPFILFHASHSPNPSSLSPHALSLCVSPEDRGQAARQAGGLVCGTVLISTGVLRQKATLTTTTNPPPPNLLISFLLPVSASLEVGSITPLASPGLWRMSLPAVFFMDGCQPLPVSSVHCHSLVYSHLSLFPTSCRLSVNELCVSSPFLFSSFVSGRVCFFIF